MEKVIVFYEDDAERFFNKLVYILLQNDYFSFEHNALLYRDRIVEFVEKNISTFPYKKTPVQLKAFGSRYIFYKPNQRTTWYIFFIQKESIYIITNIINSHSPEAKYL